MDRMQITLEEASYIASIVSALAAVAAAIGVWYARSQLAITQKIAQTQFEDSLSKEYRELANRIPPKALLGADLDDDEYGDAFDEIFRYIDLSNEQICLRKRGRIGKDVWLSWQEGIKTNLSLPAFKRGWTEIKEKSKSFAELRKLEKENFRTDPKEWSDDSCG